MNNNCTDRNTAEVFGHTVKIMRKKRHYTQEDLSEKSGIGVPYISNIETGSANPTIKIVSALAEAFNIPIYELFSGVEKNN